MPRIVSRGRNHCNTIARSVGKDDEFLFMTDADKAFIIRFSEDGNGIYVTGVPVNRAEPLKVPELEGNALRINLINQ
jgi:hypothetical protein